ncbi:MAG TPA: TraB/GumN family protein [Xanthomonadaceae bacterium]|jgi:hypothetical protein
MRRLRAALGLALCLLLAGVASASAPTPLLWKATKGDTTVYLLGSLHILLPGDYPLSHDVEDAYHRAAQVVFELPPAEMNPVVVLGPTATYGMYQDPSQSLQDDIDPATWQRVLAYGEKNGFPQVALERMRPWLVTLTILGLELQKLSYDPNKGLDKHFMDEAAADHKAAKGFETAAQQIQVIAGTSKADQVRDLKEMLDDLADFHAKMGELHDTWRNGDAAGLYRQEMKEFAGQPEAERKLIDDRNRAWIPELERMAASEHGETLVIVGALHLLGPNGLVQLLKQDGYKVERVCTGCANVH